MDQDNLLKNLDVQHGLFGLFFQFHNCLQVTGDTFFEEMTCKQFFLLMSHSLFREKDPTLKELAMIMGCSHQNVKQIVLKLEKSGFIYSYKDPEDKRKIRIGKTEKVAQFNEKYAAGKEQFFKQFYQGISIDDLTTTYQTLIKLRGRLQGMQEETK